MRKIHKLVLAAAVLVGSVAIASASDPLVAEPAAPFDWIGSYAGGHGGFGRGDADYTFANGEGSDFPAENHFNCDAGDTVHIG